MEVECFSFSDWLISFSITFSTVQHVSECPSFLRLNNSILHIHHIVIHLSVDTWAALPLATVHDAVMNRGRVNPKS